ELGVERFRLLELAKWMGPLREDRTGIEVGVHAVERDADLVVALPDRPRDRQGASVPRQERRVAVEPAETRHRERVGWDPPREAHADHEVGLDRGEERPDGASPRGQAT